MCRTLPALLLTFAVSLPGQTSPQSRPQADRIAPQASLVPATRLPDHLPRWATPAADQGPIAPETPMRVTLLLARTPELQSAFEQLLADQQNPGSSRYHQWLTPSQIGEQFGPTPDDVAAIAAWLTQQGLQVAGIAPSRIFIETTGTASTVASAFAISLHRFSTPGGRVLFSTTSDPAIPSAFAQVVTSIQGLSELSLRPMHTLHPAQPRASTQSLNPLYSNKTNTTHYVFPGDFANIYDLNAAAGAGYNGNGVHVAIVAQSRISNSDITELEGLAGLPLNTPNQILTPNSTDPGVVPITATAGDQEESVLDVDRVITVATGAQADLLITSGTSGGIDASMQYNVNTLLDPVMTISYGACESASSAKAVAFYDALFAQAAGEGISVFVSSGDAAAAGCATQFSAPTGLEMRAPGNFLCSSSYVTCVGGTEFTDPNPGLYWSAANDVTASGGTTYTSALGYIPEGAWNEPATTSTVNGVATTTYQIAGSGSGPSAFIAKPSWQTGTGVPADGARDTPDISFSAADHDGYFACVAGAGSGFDCNQGGGAVFSGTSASAPGMAAVAALLNGRAAKAQGNLNPLLYRLAVSAPAVFHDATPATSGVTCTTATPSTCNNSVAGKASLTGGLAGYPLQTGYDLVTGLGSLDIAKFLDAAVVPIYPTTIALTASPASIPAGEVTTFTATVASSGNGGAFTGNVQFVANGTPINGASSILGNTAGGGNRFFTVGKVSLTAVYSGDSTYVSSTSPPFTLTVTPGTSVTVASVAPNPVVVNGSVALSASVMSKGQAQATGTVQFLVNGTAHGAPVSLTANGASLAGQTFPAVGSYAITAAYSGDSNNLPSTSAPVTLQVVPPSYTTTAITALNSGLKVGESSPLSATVTAIDGSVPTGTIVFSANGNPIGPPATLSGGSVSVTSPPFNTDGGYRITATYSGDSTHDASTSPVGIIDVVKTMPVVGITVSPTTITTAETTVFSASVATTGLFVPSGTIQFYTDFSLMGPPVSLVGGTAVSPAFSFPTPRTYPISASYSGDTAYTYGGAGPVYLVVNAPPPPGVASSFSQNTLTLHAGASTGNTATLTLTSQNGYQGSVALACSVTFAAGTATFPPTCTFSPTPLTLTAGATATSTLTITTTVPHAGEAPASVAFRPPPSRTLPLLSLALLPLILPFARRRTPRSTTLVLALLCGAAFISGCGSSNSGTSAPVTPPTLVGTSPGTYVITVTVTPDTGSPTTSNLSLVVQ